MAADVQETHAIAVATPLPKNDLLLIGFAGTEGISQLFRFQLDLVAKNKTAVSFDKLIGQPINISMPVGDKVRHWSGICSSISQGESDDTHTHYRMEVVPQLWLLTRKTQSRIFQNVSVIDILKKVLEDIKPDFAEVKGTFHPRDYCVQYRETDFNFACRLMEEEGICYYFTHDARGHKMILANTPNGHPDLPLGKEIIFHGDVPGGDAEPQIFDWEKSQELRSGKYTLWDHCFEKPRDHLEATKEIAPSVQVGEVVHQLKIANNDKLEIYDFPGEYAQRFDGVQPGGGDRKDDIDKIAEDKERTVGIRMQENAAHSISIQGASNSPKLLPGHKFTLKVLPGDDLAKLLKAAGSYVITRVVHTARDTDYQSGDGKGFSYSNTFMCIPAALPYRPHRKTRKPIIPGSQTATVVGSGQKDEEILTDKYGRVKVQFHWDRPGKHNLSEDQGKYKYSSCWVRVGQLWAGKRWGASFWPRIGQEVIVSFLEGDPDQPIIVGSVYNAEQMPPYLGDGLDSKHKNDNKVSGVKSNTTTGGKGYNEWRFDDTKDKEQIFIHAERNMDVRAKGSHMTSIGGNSHLTVGGEKDGKKSGEIRVKVFKDHHVTVGNDEIRLVENDQHETVKGHRVQEFQKDHHTDTSKGATILKGKTVYIDASTEIQLSVGGNFIKIGPAGISIVGTLVKINCPGDVASPVPPPPPSSGPKAGTATRKPEEPVGADHSASGLKSAPDV